jgi:hypothetical protein
MEVPNSSNLPAGQGEIDVTHYGSFVENCIGVERNDSRGIAAPLGR